MVKCTRVYYLVLADNILIFDCGKTHEDALIDHNKNLEILFRRFKQHTNYKLDLQK